jgi:hypothetical protein
MEVMKAIREEKEGVVIFVDTKNPHVERGKHYAIVYVWVGDETYRTIDGYYEVGDTWMAEVGDKRFVRYFEDGSFGVAHSLAEDEEAYTDAEPASPFAAQEKS